MNKFLQEAREGTFGLIKGDELKMKDSDWDKYKEEAKGLTSDDAGVLLTLDEIILLSMGINPELLSFTNEEDKGKKFAAQLGEESFSEFKKRYMFFYHLTKSSPSILTEADTSKIRDIPLNKGVIEMIKRGIDNNVTSVAGVKFKLTSLDDFIKIGRENGWFMPKKFISLDSSLYRCWIHPIQWISNVCLEMWRVVN